MTKELERLKASLEENIDDTNHWLENAPTDTDWHWHVGYRTALQEVLKAIKDTEE
jgi:hypothetical protein